MTRQPTAKKKSSVLLRRSKPRLVELPVREFHHQLSSLEGSPKKNTSEIWIDMRIPLISDGWLMISSGIIPAKSKQYITIHERGIPFATNQWKEMTQGFEQGSNGELFRTSAVDQQELVVLQDPKNE